MYAQSPREIRETFWKTFGKYMSLVPGASGERINWVNYKTGNKAVKFIMDIAAQRATIALVVSDPATFDTIRQLRPIFVTHAGENWDWANNQISQSLHGKDLRRQEDWPELISFFKERLLQLDAFWEEVKYALE